MFFNDLLIVDRDEKGGILNVKLDGIVYDTTIFSRVKVLDSIGKGILSEDPKEREAAEKELVRAIRKLRDSGELKKVIDQAKEDNSLSRKIDGFPDVKIVHEKDMTGKVHTLLEFDGDRRGYGLDITNALEDQADTEVKTPDRQREDAQKIYDALKTGNTKAVRSILQSYLGVEFQTAELIQALNGKLEGTAIRLNFQGGVAELDDGRGNVASFNLITGEIESDGGGLAAIQRTVMENAEKPKRPSDATGSERMDTKEEIRRLIKGTRPNAS